MPLQYWHQSQFVNVSYCYEEVFILSFLLSKSQAQWIGVYFLRWNSSNLTFFSHHYYPWRWSFIRTAARFNGREYLWRVGQSGGSECIVSESSIESIGECSREKDGRNASGICYGARYPCIDSDSWGPKCWSSSFIRRPMCFSQGCRGIRFIIMQSIIISEEWMIDARNEDERTECKWIQTHLQAV